jgi:hypothetical protein
MGSSFGPLRLQLQAEVAVALLVAIVWTSGLTDRSARSRPLTAVAVAAAAAAASGVTVDDVITPATASAPPAPPPVPKAVSFAQMPADTGVAVFIPVRPGVAQTRIAMPNATAGYSPTTTLTFDDCGDPANMGALVDVLERNHRQALFFVTGQCRDRYPWLVTQLKAAGHQVCNHTYSHPDLRRLGDAAIRAEIRGGVMAGCPYFRPPYGSWDGPRGRIARIAAEFGLSVMLWDVDTRDWADADPDAMVATIRARGGVVLFHLHGRGTVKALSALG